MTGPEIACGEEFAAGTLGELQLKGPVRDVTWPYSGGGPADGNGLYVDPEQGLWTPRRDVVLADLSQTLSAGGTTVGPGNQYTWPAQQVSITNPSPVQRAAVFCGWEWAWTVDILSGAVADVHVSIIRLDNRTEANWRHGATNGNMTGSGTAPTWTWWGSRTDLDIEYLETGQTSTYRIECRVKCGPTGSLRAQSATLTIKMLGVLL